MRILASLDFSVCHNFVENRAVGTLGLGLGVFGTPRYFLMSGDKVLVLFKLWNFDVT